MMCLVYTLSIADRYVVSTVLDPIRHRTAPERRRDRWLTGVALAFFYVILGFPLSWLIDRKSRRKIIAVCLVVWSVMTAFCGLARTTWRVLPRARRCSDRRGRWLRRGQARCCRTIFRPAAGPWRSPCSRSARPLGAYVGYNVAGTIADHYGWRAVFFALGIPGVLAGIAVWLTVREPKRGCLDSGSDGGSALIESHAPLHVEAALRRAP